MKRTYTFNLVIECENSTNPDVNRVEQLLDLSLQELVHDDHFIAALDEHESVSIITRFVR